MKFQCPPNRPFRCKNDRVCLWIGRQCDGIDNCGDNTDEKDCGECGLGWLLSSGWSLQGPGFNPGDSVCFTPSFFQKSGGERWHPGTLPRPLSPRHTRGAGCPGLQSVTAAARAPTESPTAKPKSCSQDKNEFLCENKKCISANLRCNFFDDCGDGSDEKSCSHGAWVAGGAEGECEGSCGVVGADRISHHRSQVIRLHDQHHHVWR